ncbi:MULTISPECIES: hypothetical protein [Acinetobacter]|uniref:TynE n=1 Tax=Acinetobacter higginsii TaxID=70347 RepID=N9SL49_9GAMM|nr:MULTISPECIES: hypothetical protein [Acinetobacter]ENX55341.1 hypothetical protein F902_03411 [Acinetobacter higginsii]
MKTLLSQIVRGTLLVSCFSTAYAGELEIKPIFEATFGAFSSAKSYNGENIDDQRINWQEGHLKYGAKGQQTFQNHQFYASLSGISSATWGDGDAGQNSNGQEHKTDVNEWVIGFKDGSHKDELTTYNFSIGRQNIMIGDGFFVAGDALNLGKAPADGALDRGGAYYLAARRSFDFTSLLQYKPQQDTTLKLAYLKSNNKAQFSSELFVTDLMYQLKDKGVGFTYLDVLDLEDAEQVSGREDLKNYALRLNYQVLPELQLKSEWVVQDKQDSTENAGYLGLNYNFLSTKYTPSLGYRFSHFSDQYDPMFYGNTVGFGTWFQGEVAGNYAGPFNKNADIHQVSYSINLKENFMLGALAYKFQTVNKLLANVDGHELDVFSVWSVNNKLTVIPLIGLYKPKHDIHSGGTQNYDDKTNLYAQLILQYIY